MKWRSCCRMDLRCFRNGLLENKIFFRCSGRCNCWILLRYALSWFISKRIASTGTFHDAISDASVFASPNSRPKEAISAAGLYISVKKHYLSPLFKLAIMHNTAFSADRGSCFANFAPVQYQPMAKVRRLILREDVLQ